MVGVLTSYLECPGFDSIPTVATVMRICKKYIKESVFVMKANQLKKEMESILETYVQGRINNGELMLLLHGTEIF